MDNRIFKSPAVSCHCDPASAGEAIPFHETLSGWGLRVLRAIPWGLRRFASRNDTMWDYQYPLGLLLGTFHINHNYKIS